jgi:hypothetical protein
MSPEKFSFEQEPVIKEKIKITEIQLPDWETIEERKESLLKKIEELTQGQPFLICGITENSIDSIGKFRSFSASTKEKFINPEDPLDDAWRYAHGSQESDPAFIIYKEEACVYRGSKGEQEEYDIPAKTPIEEAIFGIIVVRYTTSADETD